MVIMSKKWYVVHVFSGSEKKVCQSIEEQVISKNMKQLDYYLVSVKY